MTSNELNNQANGTRLSRLLIDKGTKVLKAAFDLHYPPATLAADLIANKPTLRRLRYNAINAAQWWLLYPSAGSPDSKNFDITLLTVLLQELCGLMPATGWSAMPPPSNTSIAANILRIKLYRNQVYAHITTTQIDDVSFEHLWQKISRALVALGIPQKEIDELKEAPISLEEDECIEQLKEWKKSEDEIKEKLDEAHGTMRDTHGMVKDMHGMVKDTHGTTRDTHGMMKDTHGMVKDTHGMTKDTHGLMKDTHGIVEDAHGMTKDAHGITKDTHGMVKDIHGQLAGVCPEQSDENVLLQLANCNFRGNIECLAKSCYPGTRDWLLQKVNNWLEEEELESRVMILTAGPGVGKSVFSAKVCELYEKEGRLAASHFCKFNNSDYRNPHTMLQSLASHMCQSVPGFKKQLIKALRRPHSRQTIPEAFRVLLNDPLHALKSQKPMLIVIDALDESEVGGKSALLDMIAEEFPKLPKWVKFLVTSRPELVVQKKLSHLNPLEICPGDKDNKKDLVHYLSGCLSDKCKAEKFVIEMLAEKCEGSFLYAYYAQRQLLHQRSKSLTREDVRSFMCEGISTFYEKQFESLEIYLNKLSPTRCNFKQFLAVLAAAKSPLPLSLLPTCLGLPESLDFDVRKGINDIMSTFLPVYDDCLTIYHKSLVDWLQLNGDKQHSYTVSKDIGTEFLWRMCKTEYQEMTSKFPNINLSKAMEYALKHGTGHLLDLDENYATDSDYEFLVDFVIVYLKSLPGFGGWFQLNRDLYNVLKQRTKMNLRLQVKFQWHLAIFPTQVLPRPCSWYAQNVANSSPSYTFTREEIEKAKYVLKDQKYVWCENVNIQEEVNDIPILAVRPVYLHGIPFVPPKEARLLSVSPRQKVVAVVHDYNSISIFKVPYLEMVSSFRANEFDVRCLTFCPDDSRILYGTLNYCLDAQTGMKSSFFAKRTGEEANFVACSFSPNGRRLVTSDGSEIVKLWDVNRQIPLASLYAGAPVNHCTFSHCGLFIVGKQIKECMEIDRVNDFDESDSLTVWNAITLQRVDQRENLLGNSNSRVTNGMTTKKFLLPSETAGEIIISENGNFIEVFVLPQALLVARFPRFDNPFTLRVPPAVKYDNWNCVLDSAGSTLRIIDPLRLTVVTERNLPSFCSTIPTKHLHHTGDFVLAVSGGSLFVVKAPSQPSSFPAWPSPRVTSCSFSPDGSLLATCVDDSWLKVWDMKTCNVLQSFKISSGWKQGSWWSNEALWILSVTEESTSLLKFPVDETQGLENLKMENIPLRFGQTKLLCFSHGVLILKCEDDLVLVTKIVGGEVGSKQILPVDKPVECAVVCDCSLIVTANVSEITLWKVEKSNPNNYWVSYGTRFFHDIGIRPLKSNDGTLSPIDSDGEYIYYVHAEEESLLGDNDIYMITCVVEHIVPTTDLPRRCFQYLIRRAKPGASVENLCMRLSTQREFLIVSFNGLNTVLIADHQQGVLAQWITPGKKCLRRFSETSSIPFSPEHNLLAIPDERGNIQFIKIHFNKEHAGEFYKDIDDIDLDWLLRKTLLLKQSLHPYWKLLT